MSVSSVINKLSNIRTVAPKAIRNIIRDLAYETIIELNAASGINQDTSDTLVIYKLSKDHWERVPGGDLCDELANAETEFGMGVYDTNKLPDAIKPVGASANVHKDCRCSLIPLVQAVEEKGWKVIINDAGVEFINESPEIMQKVQGTAVKLKDGAVADPGNDPDRYAENIIEGFQGKLQVGVESVLQQLTGGGR